MDEYEKWLDKRIAEIEYCGDSYNEKMAFIREISAIYCAGFITQEQFYEACKLAHETRERIKEAEGEN